MANLDVSDNLTVGTKKNGDVFVELGNQNGQRRDAFIDFHTTANVVKYNARIKAYGGNEGNTGDGVLEFSASQINLDADAILSRTIHVDNTLQGAGGYEFNINSNGSYARIGQLLVQWGSRGSSTGKNTATFPIPFRDTNYFVTGVTPLNSYAHVNTNNLSKSQFQYEIRDGGSTYGDTIRWFAVGYHH